MTNLSVGDKVQVKVGGMRGTIARVASIQGDRATIVLLEVDKSGYAAGNTISVRAAVLRRCEESKGGAVAVDAVK